MTALHRRLLKALGVIVGGVAIWYGLVAVLTGVLALLLIAGVIIAAIWVLTF